MPIEAEESIRVLVKRIFLAQIILIVISTTLVYAAGYADLGFFWFAFLAGVFGSSVALLRRVQKGDTTLAQNTLRSWGTTLMPFLYGGMMAAVTYFLFVSEILSGKEGDGLLATNLFPDFHSPPCSELEASAADGVKTIDPTAPPANDSGRLAVKDWFDLRPDGLPNAGKLIVWCFLAGYSESFVSGVLQRLEQKTGGDAA